MTDDDVWDRDLGRDKGSTDALRATDMPLYVLSETATPGVLCGHATSSRQGERRIHSLTVRHGRADSAKGGWTEVETRRRDPEHPDEIRSWQARAILAKRAASVEYQGPSDDKARASLDEADERIRASTPDTLMVSIDGAPTVGTVLRDPGTGLWLLTVGTNDGFVVRVVGQVAAPPFLALTRARVSEYLNAYLSSSDSG